MNYSPNVCSFSPYYSVKRGNFRGDNQISLSAQSGRSWILVQVAIVIHYLPNPMLIVMLYAMNILRRNFPFYVL
jgi:hypothetical protein